LLDGVADEPAAPGSAARAVTRYFGNEAWGDINGDGRNDVAFVLTQETGGSGTFFYAVVALASESGFVGSQAVLLGDRIAPQSTEIRPDGTIDVTFADRAPGEGFSTPPSIAKSIRLKLNAATLQLGELVQNFEGEANPDAMTLDMKTWTWVRAMDGGNEIVPRRADAFTLTFRPDGTFSATTDCNRVMGGYELEGATLEFGTMAATKMFCADAQESVFTELLGRARSYSFTARGELLLRLEGDGNVITLR
jgi:heat shock protein HslJ